MRRIALQSGLLITTILSVPVLAQENRIEGTVTNNADIVVTASRQATSLQDTALNINVVSAERLAASGVTDTSQLQRVVPNLQFSSSGQSSFVYLRGIGSNIFGGFSSNSVATYVDGVYAASQGLSTQELFDVQRVEVLRGPQATLYGRNATGGAILLSTENPTDTLSAKFDSDFGNYNNVRVSAAVSGPVIGDTVKARIAVLKYTHDGYTTNLRTGDGIDTRDYWAVRGTLLIDPSETISVTIKGNYARENGAPGSSYPLEPNSAAFSNGPPFPFPPFGPQWLASRYSSNPREVYNDIINHLPTETYGGLLKVDLDLGGANLVSTSSYQADKIGPTFQDLDDSEALIRGYFPGFSEGKYYFQDVILSSNPGSGPLNWMVGGTYTKEKTKGGGAFLTQYGPFGDPVEPSSFASDKAYAVYGQASYDLSSMFRVLAGLRYTSETRSGRSGASSKKVTWEDISPKFSLEFRPRADLLAYVSATKGFKSGVFDPRDLNNVGNPEKIWNYEAGVKATFLDGRATFNANAFYYDYTDLQVFSGRQTTNPNTGQVEIIPLVQNAGSATVKGIEVETTIRPTDIFTVGANIGYLDAHYGKGSIQADTSVAGNPLIDINGYRMLQAPKFSGSLFLEANLPLGDESSLVFNADVFHQSSRYFTAFEDASLKTGSYTTANARLTYNLPGNNVYVAGYIRNIGNTLIVQSIGRVLPVGRAASYGAPRLYGVQMGFRF
ncbi:iron complex outermembrane recepter protein [Sphingobium sp. AP50]|uniref:TonB-dependent receptor n=1 Tax=Sphingobium sp. AP50 TaxID=1884369 RepID=UPI0008CD1568|nr:TonB-dependent receptor [Sphingobium sp. AP50]SEK06214.1 iron complex outermembrane recepter protein [Sphingobium sp. AP50]